MTVIPEPIYRMVAESDAERCPVCPAAGPPNRSKSAEGETTSDNADDELYWIACTKCETWYHSTCLVQGEGSHRSTIPETVLSALPDHDGAWTNWTSWMDKWYCRKCLNYSVSPENPRPPRHPLKATLKSGYPPKSPHSLTRKAKDASSTLDSPPGPAKRARLSSSVQPDEGARPKRKAAENAPDYHAWNHGIPTPTGNWLKLIQDPEKYGANIKDADFPQVPGSLLSKAWLESHASTSNTLPGWISPTTFYGTERRPILVRPENGGIESMGGKLPEQSLTVGDVAEQLGRNHAVDVIDVASQTSAQWNLGKWAEYFKASAEPDWNGKVYNIISLEITGTPLAKKVTPPRVVREIDWVDNHWHFEGGRKKAIALASKEVNGDKDSLVTQDGDGWVQEKAKAGAKWPKVQLYCLMGIKGSWTDWHIDFAASSVYYSIHTGSKVFFFIKPTEHNLKMYAQWSGDADLQQSKWLGDMCEGGVEKCALLAGDTMIIPAGYIHAVYTPVNTMVFGGNFLHSYSIPTQLRLRQIEIDTKVPQKFRFPFLERLVWYVADRYCSDLRQLRAYRPKPLSTPLQAPHLVVLQGLMAIAEFLQAQVDILEDEAADEKRKKIAYERIPGDVVKDAAGLARELKWRAERELPEDQRPSRSQLEHPIDSKDVKSTAKRRTIEDKMTARQSRTDGFRARPWSTESFPSEVSETTSERARPKQDGKPGDVQPVEIRTEISRQTSKRQYALLGDQTVVEERNVVVTDRRYIWGGDVEAASVEVPNGDGAVAKTEGDDVEMV